MKTTISIKSDERDEFLAAVKESQVVLDNLYAWDKDYYHYELEYTHAHHLFYLGCKFTVKTDLKLVLKTLER